MPVYTKSTQWNLIISLVGEGRFKVILAEHCGYYVVLFIFSEFDPC